jgi:peptidoglycan/xylan/chitin deacetylase (PgdA/CDA1 family)
MLDVFFTVDVEVWCGGWKNIDAKFPRAFQQYVYGRTPRGEYGLRYKLKELQEHGLKGVFFVEALFATRFGLEPLKEIVGLIKEYGHEVQLHLHPEWADESREPIVQPVQKKRQFLRDFSLGEQTALIKEGLGLIERADGGRVNAFRAGSFGFNSDTLHALAANGIQFDSSYNASIFGLDSGIMTGQAVVEPVEFAGVCEYPMTVFDDGTRSLRHAQLGACTYYEMEGLLWQALENNRKAFVILSHNFELLNTTRDRADEIIVNRFRKFCRFIDKNRDCFRTRGFHNLRPTIASAQPTPLYSPIWKTSLRMAEQLMRMRYG